MVCMKPVLLGGVYHESKPFVEILPSTFPSLPSLRHNDILMFGREAFGYALSQAIYNLASWYRYMDLINGEIPTGSLQEAVMDSNPRVRLLAFANPLCTEEMRIMSSLAYGDPLQEISSLSKV